MKKKTPIGMITVILVLGIFLLSFTKQFLTIRKINQEIRNKTQQIEELQEKNKKMQADLEAAQSNYDYMERLARERLGLIKEGEQVVIPTEPQE